MQKMWQADKFQTTFLFSEKALHEAKANKRSAP